jgi:chemotaxis protein MotB
MKLLLKSRDEEVPTWPSFTDVALSVAGILLLYLMTQVAISSQTSVAMLEIRERQTALRQAVQNAIPVSMHRDLTITEDGNLQRYTFADQVLFDTGKADLKPSGMTILDAMGHVFKEQVGAFTQIQIEGHTDDRPIKFPFPSNWELSSARATSVVRFLGEQTGLDPALLSATGYSQYHPVDTRPIEEGRARNRRIELVVVYSVQNVLDKVMGSSAHKKEAGHEVDKVRE